MDERVPNHHRLSPALDLPPVLTAAMAADLLQVHVESLRRMVRERRVPCHRFPGGRELRFLRDELLQWLYELPADDAADVAPNVSLS